MYRAWAACGWDFHSIWAHLEKMGQSQNVRVYDVQGSFTGEVRWVHISDKLVSSICAVQACRFVVSAVANGYVGVAY